AHIMTGSKDALLSAACWFISMMLLESCCICASVRPKRPLLHAFHRILNELNTTKNQFLLKM
ncbi:MAG: hypothetical protein O3A15_06230, partial [Proteobacteria bacterium]|nr:hypothetical protein [Pseudomonadota bacterium]